MDNIHMQFSLSTRGLFSCMHNRHARMESLQVVYVISLVYAKFYLKQSTLKPI